MPIPVNILDKVKFELNKRNSYQYFFTFNTYEGEIEENKLRAAFQKLYSSNEKLNMKLHFNGREYNYIPKQFDKIFYWLEENEIVDPTSFIEKYAKEYISASEEAPLLLVLLKNKTRYSLILFHNHVYYDGTTAYLLQNQLFSLYNGENPFPCLLSISDSQAIEARKKQMYSFNKGKYMFSMIRHIFSSIKHTSFLNNVKKIYQNENVNPVLFHYFSISHPKKIKESSFSTNTIVCSLIAKAFLAVKGNKTKQKVSIAIPANFRDESIVNRLGNLVYIIPAKLNHKMSIEKMQELIQKKVLLFKKKYKEIAAYQLLHMLANSKVGKQLSAIYKKISKKHHFYITNFGNYAKRFTCTMGESKLLTSGGFNFPIQEDNGLLFTIVPYRDKIGIGIASSSLVFSKEELQTFEKHLLKISTFS